MTRWLAQRLLMLVPVLFGVSVIVFLTMAMVPGDPALAILGPYATPERIEEIRASMGLDRPLPVQYLIWIGDVL
jgi:peptide/nickel transport system permease protein